MLIRKCSPFYTLNKYEDPPIVDPPKVDPPVEKTFKQADVDRMVAESRRKDQAEIAKTTTALKKLQEQSGMTEKEKAELQTRIDELDNQYKTKEQLAAQEQEKRDSKYKTDMEATATERDTWKRYHHDSTIENAIIRTAASDAVNVEQIQDLLKPKSRVQEGKDTDGKPNGQFTVMVKLVVDDKKTKSPVTLDLSIDDAIKQMKENPQRYGNLFKSTMSGGLGGSGGGGGGGKGKGGPLSGEDITGMSDEQYIAARKARGGARR